MKMERDRSSYHIRTVSRAIDVLEQFHGDHAELGVTALSKSLSLGKNNVFRLLATLASRDYVEQNPETGSYRLGLKNFELGQTMVRQMGLLRQARPVIESMAARCNETTDLAVLKGGHILYVDAVETDLPVRVSSRLGSWFPVHCTAASKVHLAFMSADELTPLIPRGHLQRYTANTVTDLKKLRQQLRQIAMKGYAIDDEELEVGVRCVSAPIRDFTKKVVGAVSISGPVTRVTKARITRELIPLVQSGAAEISCRLGYR